MALLDPDKEKIIDDLSNRYSSQGSWKHRIIYYRKKYLWLLATKGTKFIKRAFDMFASFCALVVLFPFMLFIALIIKMLDGGPVLYTSIRVGQWGKEFSFPKFRSMRVEADKIRHTLDALNDHKEGVTFKMKEDPRVTSFGKFLRKTSIDELPQLWCVLKGEMSLVGPRPALPQEVAAYNLEERRRLEVPPGLTCIWQVSGRSDIPFNRQVQLDVDYIESQSLWEDIKILFKTIPAVLFGRGAY